MPGWHYDIIVEIDHVLARLRVLTPEARDWIETHVTLERVQIWTGNMLEVAPRDIGKLLADLLADGLKISTAHGRTIEDRVPYGSEFFMTSASHN